MGERFRYRDARGLRASITRRANPVTTTRCGSYPLMNLAADYGVAYADVLIWAGYYRLKCLDEPIPPYLQKEANRLFDAWEKARKSRVWQTIIVRSSERWCSR